jgi:hypothetical protein
MDLYTMAKINKKSKKVFEEVFCAAYTALK